MRVGLSSIPRLAAGALFAFAIGVGLGCYNPNIGEGEFRCGPGGLCPDGFSCSAGACYRTPPAGDGGSTLKDAGSCVGPLACVAPAASTKPGVCDLACQSGCQCSERCALRSGGPTCVAPAAEPKGNHEECEVMKDNCRPGSMCFPLGGACGARCFKFCNGHQDCGGDARCTTLASVGTASALACSAPIEACNPSSKRARCLGMKDDSPFGCYVLSPSGFPDLAVCDCAGTKDEGNRCDGEHDCRPGLECWKPPGAMDATCLPVCPLNPPVTVVGPACLFGKTCRPFELPANARSKVYGYCF